MDIKEYLSANYSPTSSGTHYNNIMRYLAYIGERAVVANYQDIIRYIEMLRKQELHPKTLRNYLFCVKMYYRYLQATGVRKDHPCRRLNLKDQINRAIPVETLYSEQQLTELVENYQALDKRLQQRNQVMVSLLVYQGLNIREVANLQLSDIDLEKGEIKVKGSVKLNGRTLPLKPQQIMLFYNYIRQGREYFLAFTDKRPESFITNKYGNPIIDSTVRGILRDKVAPEGKFIANKIRQSVIANLLKKNELRVVQVFAGHKRSSATEAYRQTGLEELKTAVDKLHPLQ